MQKNSFRLALASVLVALCCGLDAGAQHTATTNVNSFTLIIEFQGLVDLISDGTANPTHMWIVLPDVSDVAKLELHEDIKGDPSGYKIEAHQAMLFGEGLPMSTLRCGQSVASNAWSIRGYRVEIEGHFLESDLLIERSKRSGSIPCDPAVDPSCTRPVAVQQASVAWLPMIDDLLAYRPSLRKGLLDDGAGVAATVFRFELGRLITTNLWKQADNTYYTAGFGGVPPNVWSQRATATGLTLIVQALGSSVTIRRTEIGVLAPQSESTNLKVTGPIMRLIVENHPLGSVTHGVRVCDGGSNDFASHYVLREDSDKLLGPLMELYDEEGNSLSPYLDPQCSPADNRWP